MTAKTIQYLYRVSTGSWISVTGVRDFTKSRRRHVWVCRISLRPFNLFTVGKRAVPVSGAKLWNSLPSHVTSAPSLAIFRQRL